MIQPVAPFVVETAGLPADTFVGEVALVTGAGQGIGQQVARTLAALGAQVVLAELSSRGSQVAGEIVAAGGQACFVQTDVSDEASVAALFRAVAELGPVSLLINNAAYEPVAAVRDMEVAEWDRAVAVNLRGTFLTCRAALPAMLARGHGTIVNMVSAEAMPGMAAYIASKHGIVGFTQSLALEVGQRGIRVVALAPGMVDTPGLRGLADRLAPHLGLAPEQFLGVSLHAAYTGLMPAAHAAAATAYLAAHLADDYHGEVVTGYTVLEQAGLIAPAARPTGNTGAAAAVAERVAPPRDQVGRLEQALGLTQELQSALIQTEAEFNQLPLFARPLARGAMKSRTGMRVQDGLKSVVILLEQLRRMQAPQAAGEAGCLLDQPQLVDWLSRLAAYYQGVPAETARFTRDAATLAMVARQSEARVSIIRRLLAIITELQPDEAAPANTHGG